MTPLDRATRGYLSTPLSIATLGLISLGTVSISVPVGKMVLDKAPISVAMDKVLAPKTAAITFDGRPVALARETHLVPFLGALAVAGHPVLVSRAIDTVFSVTVGELLAEGAAMQLGGNTAITPNIVSVSLEAGTVFLEQKRHIATGAKTTRVEGLRVKTSVSIPPTFWSEEQPEVLGEQDYDSKPEIYE